jgi:hypothetical protein
MMVMARRKREAELKQVNLLDLAPVRVAVSEAQGELVVVHRPKPREHGLRRLGGLLLHVLSAHRIRLDQMGSFVWRRLDGRVTVRQLARELREQFGEAVEPAEERLGHLIRVLRREDLIAYPGWDEYDSPAPAPRENPHSAGAPESDQR